MDPNIRSCKDQKNNLTFSSRLLFRSGDIDETRQIISGEFSPHQLNIIDGNRKLDASMSRSSINGISFSRLQYGAEVAITPSTLNDFSLVLMPVIGAMAIECGDQSLKSKSGIAAVTSPGLPLRMRWSSRCEQLIVRIDRAMLEQHCVQHLGHGLDRPIVFDLGMDLDKGGVEWLRMISYLTRELDDEASNLLRSPLARNHLAQLVLATLLMCQPNNYRERLLRPTPPIAPRYIRMVEKYIEANVDQPITIVDMARHAGVSTRALYSGFRNFRNTSPGAYLKGARLRRVHEDLKNARNGETVTSIAMRWGFVHHGNFAAAYKRLFGKCPANTLKGG